MMPGPPRPRLVILCGLPGSGKTTLAKALEHKLGAIRLSADEWLDELSLALWDQDRRAKIEPLQWSLCCRDHQGQSRDHRGSTGTGAAGRAS